MCPFLLGGVFLAGDDGFFKLSFVDAAAGTSFGADFVFAIFMFVLKNCVLKILLFFCFFVVVLRRSL